MTVQTPVSEIKQLSFKERLELLEAIARSLQAELVPSSQPEPASSLNRSLGILKPEGPMPTDEELKEDYINYLIEKYS